MKKVISFAYDPYPERSWKHGRGNIRFLSIISDTVEVSSSGQTVPHLYKSLV